MSYTTNDILLGHLLLQSGYFRPILYLGYTADPDFLIVPILFHSRLLQSENMLLLFECEYRKLAVLILAYIMQRCNALLNEHITPNHSTFFLFLLILLQSY